MTRTIPGRLDAAAYAALAGTDRRREPLGPPGQEQAIVAVRDLRAQGLSVRDISSALGIGEAAVRQLLEVDHA